LLNSRSGSGNITAAGCGVLRAAARVAATLAEIGA
jgi:hypothetical protein